MIGPGKSRFALRRHQSNPDISTKGEEACLFPSSVRWNTKHFCLDFTRNQFWKSWKVRFLPGNKIPTMFNVWQDLKLIKAIGFSIHVETPIIFPFFF